MATTWNREDVLRALGDANVQAMLHVIREGETGQTASAYYRVNGRADMTSLAAHPYHGITTTNGARASGAYQHLGTTWARIAERYPNDVPDFSPSSQDFAAVVGLFDRRAIDAVRAGDLAQAIRLLKDEWISLPMLGWERAKRVFLKYGGTLAGDTQPAAPIEDRSTEYQPSEETKVDPLTIAGIFGAVLTQLIPQVGKLFGGKKDAQNAQAIGVVLDTVVKASAEAVGTATGAPVKADVASVAAAVKAMQDDPAVQKAVQKAVVTEPTIMMLLEVGGGAAAARKFDIAQQQQEKPFWKVSAVFWMSVLLLPIAVWLVGSLIVGGAVYKLLPLAKDMGVTLPSWMLLLLSLFGDAWQGETRSGGFNLVIGLVLGGISGVYYGVSVTQQRPGSGDGVGTPPQT